MRLGLITDEVGQDLEEALDLAEEFGIRDVELRSVWGKNVIQLSAEEVARVGRLIRARGMRVVSVAGPVYKCHLHPDEKQKTGDLHGAPEDLPPAAHLELLRREIALAEEWGAPFVRTFAFWRDQEFLSETILDEVAAALRRLLEVMAASGSGCRLLLENEHACYVGSGAEVEALWQRPGLDGLGLIWDPGNAFWRGERPYPDGFRAVLRGPGGERLLHVHVKDARRTGDQRHPYAWSAVGEGEIDFPGQFAALAEMGYQGVLSLETHWRPAGGNGKEGSRHSLQGMVRALEKAGLTRDEEGDWK